MDMPNLALASHLARRGHEVHVVTYRADPSLSVIPFVKIHRVPKPFDSYMLGAPLLATKGLSVARKVLGEGGRVLSNGGNCPAGDVNWVHYVHAAYKRVPPRGWRVAKEFVDTRASRLTERRALLGSRLVVANSLRTRSDLIRHLGLPPERIRTVYYGLDERFHVPTAAERAEARAALELDDRPALCFVGALGDQRKGFDTLFDAWSLLRRDWDAVLLVVGRGALQEHFRQRAQAQGFSNIRFLGFRTDVPRILHAADGMVAPTRYEAFGQAVLEAVASGLPAVVSADAGVVERLGAEFDDLLLHDVDSASELADRLRRWRDGLARFRSAAERRSALVRERTWDVMAEEIHDLMFGERAHAP
jgi:glycosyltransferase involved in cell wall biosynthesis